MLLGDFAANNPVFDFLVDYLGWPNVRRIRVERTEIGDEVIISISGQNSPEGPWKKVTCFRDKTQFLSQSEYDGLVRAYRCQRIGLRLVWNNGWV